MNRKYSRVSHKEKIKKIEQALENLARHQIRCTLCPHECGANRLEGETGFCETGLQASISHALRHFGEEPVLSGYHNCATDGPQVETPQSGSGTIFFSGCNLKCLYCQNYQVSWLNQGRPLSVQELAETILALQAEGALNINLVSPMHVLIPVLQGLKQAYLQGFCLPVVYNTNAYEKVEVLRQLEGIIDVYLPDLKYHSPEIARKYSNRSDYFLHASQAIMEMHRQQPELMYDTSDTAQAGLIIRHLVLPGMVEDSLSILEWLAENISLPVGLSLMSQYVPCYKAPEEIQKKLSSKEYQKVVTLAQDLGFETLFIQPELFDQREHLVPDFNQKSPFKWRPE